MSVHGLVHGFREFAVVGAMCTWPGFASLSEFTGTTEWLGGLYVVVLPKTVRGKIVVPILSTYPGYGSCTAGH